MSANETSDGGGSTPTDGDGPDDEGRDRRTTLGFALLAAGVIAGAIGHPVLESENRLYVAGVATAALILGLFYAADHTVTAGRFWRPPDPEPGSEIPVPGESFERLSGRKLGERIRTRVLVSLLDATDWSKDTAEARLDAGTWTDDRLAAAALSDDVDPPIGSRLYAWLTGADLDERARRRAMEELAALRTGGRRHGSARDADPPVSNRTDHVEVRRQ